MLDMRQGLSQEDSINYIVQMLESIKASMALLVDAESDMEEMPEYLSPNISREETK